MPIQTTTPEETRLLGQRLAQYLKSGDTVALIGDLGAGKTLLAQGLCRGLGFQGEVTSPSYVHMHTYPGKTPIHHVDLYLDRNLAEVWSLGLEESLTEDAITIIEWADRFPEVLPANHWTVKIDFNLNQPSCRQFEILMPDNCEWLI